MENEIKTFSESYAMKGGEGLHSYAQNSIAQRVGIEAAKSLIQRAIANKFDPNSAYSRKQICIADLGCSTGPNTFTAVQCIIEALELQYKSQGLVIPEFQVFFNDQVSNDFNTLFKKIPCNTSYFAAGVPGSFYGRLFPKESLNVVHSSASLNWISKVPKEITERSSAAWNKGRIHYTNAPKEVVDAYASQYQKDIETFLHARAQELVGNGLMALQIPVANDVTFGSDFYCGKNFELLGTCLVNMAKEGKVDEEKVDNFNLPIYFSTLKDLIKIIESNDDFIIDQMETTDTKTQSIPVNVEAYVSLHRAALEGLIVNHFGAGIVDELFDCYAKKVMEIPAIMDIQNLNVVGIFVLLRRKY
ncbi:loganic acid O-methyltransferase [Cicer arietinum]|uniref:Probable S-adenosylmethionine-dependent methyltransferase At5g38100 n=1 Tax=Cicer arietinum TaxID=3827 RepID=A0A3Q7YEN9_CICAR|nr:probable S-adenosylmethionine-dependent methyltransferase At5g38100 [Cicer arietinum]XP_027189345.1 probable S-adenosylmethionine-dependent methyltransferase At5g38100 [Cicer arietinum]